METVFNEEIEDDELICPITFDIFRDPVRAIDGHVYEREAIVKWISQNNTSPLTREPLKIEELQPDDRLRHLAALRHNSSFSDNTRLNKLIIPSSTSIPRITTLIPEGKSNPVVVNRHSNKRSVKEYCQLIACVLICFWLGAVFIGAIVSASKGSRSST